MSCSSRHTCHALALPCAEQAVAFLARDTNGLARSLVALKGVFPSADVAGMVVRQPALLMERSAEQLAATAEQLRQLLPDFDTNWWEAVCVRRMKKHEVFLWHCLQEIRCIVI